MTEKKLIGIVTLGAAGLALIFFIIIVVSKNATTSGRQKEVAALAASLGDAISKSNELIRNRDFEQAKSTLQRIEPPITTLGDFDLKDQFVAAFGRVTYAEKEHRARLKNGWTEFEGEFISPDQKQRLLAERQEKRDEELRQAEHERQLAEARGQKEAADRKRREEQRKAEAKRQVEEKRKVEEKKRAEAERLADEKRRAMRPSSITWVDYRTYCGVMAQRENEARSEKDFKEKFLGKRIRWFGQVASVDTAFLGSGFVITMRMSPSDESIVSDITLSVPQEFKSLVLSLNKGEYIQFVGILTSQGGLFSDHRINVERLSNK